MSNKVSDKLNYKEYAFYLAIWERLGENVCVDGRGVLASFGEERERTSGAGVKLVRFLVRRTSK
ncbi:hypothetical protein [uncultured Phascolarctobacterium sp.]|uniref:hypothetical protein n=1 Tax=uncultured Phascolarctobacterium sp. TaxID=512296 RepID=UPI0025D155A0|nr:hypothetical protein [uncultured Phascolarctobacterium sp.]